MKSLAVSKKMSTFAADFPKGEIKDQGWFGSSAG